MPATMRVPTQGGAIFASPDRGIVEAVAVSGSPRLALVLSGGGARAAYQAGVLDAIATQLPPRAANPFAIVCGTSAGAINAAAIAAGATDFARAANELRGLWATLHAPQIYRTDTLHLLGHGSRWLASVIPGLTHHRPVSLLDNRPLGALLAREMPNFRGVITSASDQLKNTTSGHPHSHIGDSE